MPLSRWGHDPQHPRLELEHPMYRRGRKPHKLIAEAMKQARGLQSNPLHFGRLQRVRWSRSRRYTGDERRNAPVGRRRSERREVHSLVMQEILYRMDVLTLRVGTEHQGGWFRGVTCRTLAKMIGSSVTRTARAIADLIAAGYLSARQPRDRQPRPDGTWRFIGLPAIRCVTLDFFKRLGLELKLRHERRRLYQMRRGGRRAETPAPDSARSSKPSSPDAEANDSQRFFAELVNLRADPAMQGRTHDDLVALAHARLGRPLPDT